MVNKGKSKAVLFPKVVRVLKITGENIRLLTLERDDAAKIDEALAVLFRPGGSLGGARPKANVMDPSDRLWIAKFPSEHDDIDVGGWEEVTASLAQAAGLNVAESIAVKLGSKRHTFLTRRFDRGENKTRYAYASAMTLLGKKDGESEGSSYLDLAELIISQGAHPRLNFMNYGRG